MIELPEALVLAAQARETLAGRRVASAVANASPHGFAWYAGDPAAYGERLAGRAFTGARAWGGHVLLSFEDARLLFCDGVNLRFLRPGEPRPKKHQLLVDFEDGSSLSGTVQMYGGLYAFAEGTFDTAYFRVAREKPSPLSDAFDEAYFRALVAGAGKVSAKALLATEQRVPGLGNGVLQDILYNARIHPKRRADTLEDAEISALYAALRATLSEMADRGGRDVETDLHGHPGGYTTRCSRKTLGMPCPRCGGVIVKEAYLGGAVYDCPGCQRLK